MSDQLYKLAFDLCNIKSFSGKEEQVSKFIAHFLAKHKIKSEVFADFSIFAYKKKLPKYKIILCTHLDTVEPFIAPYFKQERLYGRGACDAKGIIAAMIICYLQLLSANIDDIALLFLSDEENLSQGAKKAANLLKNKTDFIILGEPTGNKFATGQKGILSFDITCEGKSCHSAYPQNGHSAIHDLIQILSSLQHVKFNDDHYFGQTTLNIGKIMGGESRNMLAANASAQVIMRLAQKHDLVLPKINELLSKKTNIEIKSSCDPTKFFVPSYVDESDKFLAHFGSDGPYIKNIGQVLLTGPGSIDLAHTIDEHITKKDLESGVSHYFALCQKLRDL